MLLVSKVPQIPLALLVLLTQLFPRPQQTCRVGPFVPSVSSSPISPLGENKMELLKLSGLLGGFYLFDQRVSNNISVYLN